MTSLLDIVTSYIDSGEARIPIFDRNATRVQQMLSDQEFDIGEIEQLIASDQALSTELLRAANSSFYGGLEKVVTIRDAMVRLGSKNVSKLVLMLTQRENYQMQDPELEELAKELWRHSVACAFGADWLAKKLGLCEVENQAMLAGLLHDVGKLMVLGVVDDLKSAPDQDFDPPAEFVIELTRSLHVEQGERLLRAWEIPDVYCDVVRQHHSDEIDESNELLLLVCLADQAANKQGIGLEPKPDLVLASTLEGQVLRVSELMLAELEVHLEDAMALAE